MSSLTSGLRGNCDQAQEVDDISGLGFKRKLNLNSSSFVKKRKMDHFDEGMLQYFYFLDPLHVRRLRLIEGSWM